MITTHHISHFIHCFRNGLILFLSEMNPLVHHCTSEFHFNLYHSVDHTFLALCWHTQQSKRNGNNKTLTSFVSSANLRRSGALMVWGLASCSGYESWKANLITVIASRIETYFFISWTSSYVHNTFFVRTIFPTPGMCDFHPFAPDLSANHYESDHSTTNELR